MAAAPGDLKDCTAAQAASLVAAWDASGVHRASTPGDYASGEWLHLEADRTGAEVSRVVVPLDRTVVEESYLACAGQRIDGLPMFDTPAAAGAVRGRLVPCGDAGEIGYLEMPPNSASIKGQKLEGIRRETRHAALVIATRVTGESLAPINAQFFSAPFGPPVLQVAGFNASFLAAQAGQGAEVEFVSRHHRETAQSFNVAARVGAPPSAAEPVVLLTPRTGWWESTAERAGGIVAWLAGLAAADALQKRGTLKRDVRAYATCGHELGHVGLEHLLAREHKLVAGAACWLHLGANLGTASNVAMTVRTDDTAAAEAMRVLLVAESYPAEAIRLEPASTFSGEGRDLAAHGARVLSLAGANAHFHAASDRWPTNVSAANVAAIARAVGKWVEGQAG
jgi:hypothetical protein